MIPGAHPHGYVPGPDRELLDWTRMNPSLFGAPANWSRTPMTSTASSALLGGRLLSLELLDHMERPPLEDSPYGLGLFVRTTTCGVTVLVDDDEALAFQAWSYATPDRQHRVTIAITPSVATDSDEVVDTFLDRVFCG